MEKKYEVIVTVVKRGHSDTVIQATREAGAKGGTIILGRGTSVHDAGSVLGVNLQPEREIILIVVDSAQKKQMMEIIYEKMSLDSKDSGICFSLPINEVVGLAK